MSEIIPRELLVDIWSRFLSQLDGRVLSDEIHLMFQIELAYWYYLDFFVEENPSLQRSTLLIFVENLYKLYPSLFANLTKYKSLSDICSSFNQYKLACHTVGAILLNKDFTKCLLVQNFNLPRTWEFPKGKQIPGEEFTKCAVREVLEETGFDITPHLDSSAYIEHTLFDRYNRHYLIVGISEGTLFQPQTRNEIRSVTWFYIDDLPRYRNDQRPKRNINLAPHLFFKIVPLMKELLEWIDYLKRGAHRPSVSNANSLTPKRDINLSLLKSQNRSITPSFYSDEDKQRLQPRFSPSQSIYIEPLEKTYYILPDKRHHFGKQKHHAYSSKTTTLVTHTTDTIFSHISFSSDNLCYFSFERQKIVDCFD